MPYSALEGATFGHHEFRTSYESDRCHIVYRRNILPSKDGLCWRHSQSNRPVTMLHYHIERRVPMSIRDGDNHVDAAFSIFVKTTFQVRHSSQRCRGRHNNHCIRILTTSFHQVPQSMAP